jgi:nucleoside-diphosphate-sugar epimerase
VTGGNGFMGSRIVRELVGRGYDVTALVGADLDNHNLDGLGVEIRPFDLLDREGVRAALEGGELLVHNAACYSFWQPDPNLIYRVNVDGTQHVLDAAAEHGYRKIVYTSSTATLTPSIKPPDRDRGEPVRPAQLPGALQGLEGDRGDRRDAPRGPGPARGGGAPDHRDRSRRPPPDADRHADPPFSQRAHGRVRRHDAERRRRR